MHCGLNYSVFQKSGCLVLCGSQSAEHRQEQAGVEAKLLRHVTSVGSDAKVVTTATCAGYAGDDLFP